MKIHSERVKRLRAEKHWSQEQLASACALTTRTIQRLESTGKASIETVRALASVFGIDADELIVSEAIESQSAEKSIRSPLNTIKACLTNYAEFKGRADRFEYWWFFLFVLLIAAVATIIHHKLYLIVAVLLIVPLVAVGARRLHDTEQSGWWQLLFLVPFGCFVVWYLLAMERKGVEVDSAEVDSVEVDEEGQDSVNDNS